MTLADVAIYGGSFDPPHMGHVLSVTWALSAGRVERVWVIPTWKHPFGKSFAASFEHRAAMCAEAFSPLPAVEVSTIERELGGVSRTLDTLDALETAHPELRFRLLLGADLLPTTDRWHRWDEIARRAPPIVVGRAGYPAPAGCPIAIPDVNSTDIRDAVLQRRDIRGFVPSAVLRYIDEHRLYGSRD